jgi:hypothetical protein
MVAAAWCVMVESVIAKDFAQAKEAVTERGTLLFSLTAWSHTHAS